MPRVSDVVDMTGVSDEDGPEVIDVSADSEEEDRLPAAISVPPRKFRGYRRGRELGRGATGKVFVCSRKDSERSFAVKVVDLRRMQLSSHGHNVRTSLNREVGILKSLSAHPNIVQMVDAFEEGSWFLLILELVGGGDLYTVLTSRDPARFLDREAAFVQKQLAEGLTFLHGQGVIHRDLKLENILVDSSCKEHPLVLYFVKIADFGLSKAVGTGRSAARSRVGTHPYTAPEVMQEGVGSYDFSSDLWCLGVLLHVLLAGQFPFDHIPAHQGDVDGCIAKYDGSQAAKAMLSGLLQLEPTRRFSLEAVLAHEWMQEGCPAWDGVPLLQQQQQGSEVKLSPRHRPMADLVDGPVQAKKQRKFVSLISSEGDRMTNAPAAAGAPNEARQPALPTAPAAVPNGPNAPEGQLAATSTLPNGQGPAMASRDDEQEQGGGGTRSSSSAPPPLTLPSQAVPAAASVASSPRGCAGAAAAAAAAVAAAAAIAAATSVSAAWTARLEPTDVHPPSPCPDVMQIHMVVPWRHAESVLGRKGLQARQCAATVGCQLQVRALNEERTSDHRVIIIGNCNQCLLVQEVLQRRLAEVVRAEGQGAAADRLDLLLFIRTEAAGVVIGKQGFVLNQIRRQSGAQIQLRREEVKGQRPCLVSGILQNVVRAERHVFDLVSAVPVAAPAQRRPPRRKNEPGGPHLPRQRVTPEPVDGEVERWKGQVGWIRPLRPLVHPQAAARQGQIYVHEQDIVTGGPLVPGQQVQFHVYSDASGLGAEECHPR